MKSLKLFLSLAIIPFSLSANDCNVRGIEPDAPVLCGNAIQGGLLYGESDWKITRPDAPACGLFCFRRSPDMDGIFVMGLPMDAGEILTLKFCKDKECNDFTYKIKQRKYQEQHIKVPDRFVSYPVDVQKRIDDESKKITESREKTDTSFIGFLDWKYPFEKKYPVTGVFGSRRVFNNVPKSPHRGWDIGAPRGTPVRSIGEGKVVLTIGSYLAGNTVIISHGFGIYSVYIHLADIVVEKGDTVTTETVIGTVGSTGRASGPHLHLGLFHNQTALDPELLF